MKKNHSDNLKELNELNTELNINYKKYKYKKYFIPKKEGIYSISLKINNISIKDCSFMFYNCKKVINIDLSSFAFENVTNISFMFSECSSFLNGIQEMLQIWNIFLPDALH